MQLYAEVQRNEKRESILKTVPVRFGTKYKDDYFGQQRFAIKKNPEKNLWKIPCTKQTYQIINVYQHSEYSRFFHYHSSP